MRKSRRSKRQSGGNTNYNGYCDNQLSQCLGSGGCTGGSRKKRSRRLIKRRNKIGGSDKYDGYCDNQPSQCSNTSANGKCGGRYLKKRKRHSLRRNKFRGGQRKSVRNRK
jgi:hypothetical protein